MKSFKSTILRLINVIYVLLLFYGLIYTGKVGSSKPPYSYETYSYKVICDNGKTFDPMSKPIDKFDQSAKLLDNPFLFNERQLISFDENQVKSECEYDDVWHTWLASKLSKNYKLESKIDVHIMRTQEDQIKETVLTFIIYYFVLELLRRTFFYVVFGKNFLTLKSK